VSAPCVKLQLERALFSRPTCGMIAKKWRCDCEGCHPCRGVDVICITKSCKCRMRSQKTQRAICSLIPNCDAALSQPRIRGSLERNLFCALAETVFHIGRDRQDTPGFSLWRTGIKTAGPTETCRSSQPHRGRSGARISRSAWPRRTQRARASTLELFRF
jgi:hypothetical protein